MDLHEILLNLWNGIILGAVGVAILVTLATITTLAISHRTENRILSQLLRMMNILAGNVGRNRNADDL